jgi:hypothetical protein
LLECIGGTKVLIKYDSGTKQIEFYKKDGQLFNTLSVTYDTTKPGSLKDKWLRAWETGIERQIVEELLKDNTGDGNKKVKEFQKNPLTQKSQNLRNIVSKDLTKVLTDGYKDVPGDTFRSATDYPDGPFIGYLPGFKLVREAEFESGQNLGYILPRLKEVTVSDSSGNGFGDLLRTYYQFPSKINPDGDVLIPQTRTSEDLTILNLPPIVFRAQEILVPDFYNNFMANE